LLRRFTGLIPDAEKAHAEYEHALSIAQRALDESPQDSARHALIGLIYAGLGEKRMRFARGIAR
jgi:Flp pilus assembly protein TadD